MRIVIPLLAVLISLVVSYAEENIEKGRSIFTKKCASCHTIGKGKLVGPDLKGITKKRDLEWLKRFIKSPSALIQEKDPTATALVKEYGAPMPDLGLSDEDVEHIIAFLEASETGPAEKGGLPALYIPTILAGIVVAGILTFLAVSSGKKDVEVGV